MDKRNNSPEFEPCGIQDLDKKFWTRNHYKIQIVACLVGMTDETKSYNERNRIDLIFLMK